jgi:hypothetical protein
MRLAGSASWRIASDAKHDLHFALFVREAAALGEVPAGTWAAPPVLDRRLAARPLADIATEQERTRAREQWPSWWDRLVNAPAPDLEAMRALVRRGSVDPYVSRLFDPLGAAPELRAVVERCRPHGLTWEQGQRRLMHALMRELSHPYFHEIGTEAERRRQAGGKPPLDARADLVLAEGAGAIIPAPDHAIVWGDALADPATRARLVDALS